MSLDPQVQIRIIELAWEWVEKGSGGFGAASAKLMIEEKEKRFDRAYQAILNTVQPKTKQ